mmetsp:Transcript_8051/g.12756  ORF Transcript_8051/g.12756 Transcript_8051/m.12756 type:complete len:84 (-) Transcript_8051:548-799(-)
MHGITTRVANYFFYTLRIQLEALTWYKLENTAQSAHEMARCAASVNSKCAFCRSTTDLVRLKTSESEEYSISIASMSVEFKLI